MNWYRHRFKTYSVSDNRPLIFNPKYPWWCSGSGEDNNGVDFDVIIVYLPIDEDLLQYWDDAFEIDSEKRDSITFTDRFPKPEYFVEN